MTHPEEFVEVNEFSLDPINIQLLCLFVLPFIVGLNGSDEEKSKIIEFCEAQVHEDHKIVGTNKEVGTVIRIVIEMPDAHYDKTWTYLLERGKENRMVFKTFMDNLRSALRKQSWIVDKADDMVRVLILPTREEEEINIEELLNDVNTENERKRQSKGTEETSQDSTVLTGVGAEEIKE